MPAPFKPKLAAAALLCGALSGQDARLIVRKAVEADARNAELARNYTFMEHSVQRQFDDLGRVKSVRSRLFDVTIQEQSPYRRLIARDGQPLSAAEQAAEMANLQRSIEERRRETPAQRAKRMQEWEKRRERQRRFLREIPLAFDFTLLREEHIEGRPVWVIRATPKPDYRPQTTEGRVLAKLAGTLWIDQTDYQWVKLEASAVETITFGWLLVRVARGASIQAEQTRVHEKLWLPKHVVATYRARIGLVKLISGQHEITYSNYRKFQAESHFQPMAPEY